MERGREARCRMVFASARHNQHPNGAFGVRYPSLLLIRFSVAANNTQVAATGPTLYTDLRPSRHALEEPMEYLRAWDSMSHENKRRRRALYQPGATPQGRIGIYKKGLKARPILDYGAGLQPFYSEGGCFLSLARFLGRCPRLVWNGPSAQGFRPPSPCLDVSRIMRICLAAQDACKVQDWSPHSKRGSRLPSLYFDVRSSTENAFPSAPGFCKTQLRTGFDHLPMARRSNSARIASSSLRNT